MNSDRTALSRAQYGTIRARLLKVACQLRLSVRRVRLSLSSVHPRQDLFRHVALALRRAIRGSPKCCRRGTDPRNPRRNPKTPPDSTRGDSILDLVSDSG